MRKPFILLLAASFTGVFGATTWWLVRTEREVTADSTQRPVATAGSSADDAHALPVGAADARTFAVPAKRASPDPVSEKAKLEAQLEQLRNGLQQRELRWQNPELRKQEEEYHRRYHERARAAAIRVAGMTDADVDQMVEFAQEKETATHAVIAASYGRPAEEVFADLRHIADEYREKLQGFLEPEKFERWDWYGASVFERSEANQFSRDLARGGDEPLQLHQVDALVEVLYAEERRWEKEYNEYIQSTGFADPQDVPPRSLEDQLLSGRARNQRIHDAMAATLSRSQLASLDRMLAGKLAYIEGAISYNESLGKAQ